MLFSLLVHRIKLRWPPSSAFCFNIAWPVVPEPAKKSNIIAFGLRHCAIRNCINDTGFGKSNARLPRIWIISRLPFRVYPTVSGKTVDNPVYLLDISLKNFFSLGRPFFYLARIYSWSFDICVLFLLSTTCLLFQINVPIKFRSLKISSHNSFRFAYSVSSILMRIIPSSESNDFAESNRFAMKDNHLEWKYPSSAETYVSSYMKSLFPVL